MNENFYPIIIICRNIEAYIAKFIGAFFDSVTMVKLQLQKKFHA